jgi:hypothetical protein
MWSLIFGLLVSCEALNKLGQSHRERLPGYIIGLPQPFSDVL